MRDDPNSEQIIVNDNCERERKKRERESVYSFYSLGIEFIVFLELIIRLIAVKWLIQPRKVLIIFRSSNNFLIGLFVIL